MSDDTFGDLKLTCKTICGKLFQFNVNCWSRVNNLQSETIYFPSKLQRQLKHKNKP